jgi:hypothetical protein
MIVQTYDDWMRMLDACAAGADWRAGSRMGNAEVLRVLNTQDQDARGSAIIFAVADALGICDRKRLVWEACAGTDGKERLYAEFSADGHPGWKYYACVGAGPRKTFVGRVGDNICAQIRVTGHPTRESAVEHLERLLGRLERLPGRPPA